MEKAIGEFEKQELFAPFSSKYDRALKGDAELTALEAKVRRYFSIKHAQIVVTAINQVKRIQQKKPLRITAISISAYQAIKN